jgi:[acyl-carrier-protein] S-malonyltransferase
MSLGILCPGQGDQSPSMFELLRDTPEAEAIFALYRNATASEPRQATHEQLHVNKVAQPVLCAFQLSVWTVLRKDLPAPRAFAGYSLGEFAAYGCAGAIEPERLIRLAAIRAAAMDSAFAGPGGLTAVRGLVRRRVQELCEKHGVEIAIVNDTDRFIIGGAAASLSSFEKEAAEAGAKVTPLKVTTPSHISGMQAAVPRFRAALSEATWHPLAAPVLAGISGAPVFTRADAIDALGRQIAHQVDWAACMDGLVELGCNVLLELGPGNGLSRMVRDRRPDLEVRSIADFNSRKGVVSWAKRSLS